MNKELKIKSLNKQVEVYNILIKKLEKVIPIIKSFDGKILNDELNDSLIFASKCVNLTGFSNKFLNIRSYSDENIQEEYEIKNVKWYEINIPIIADDQKIIANKIINEINNRIITLKKDKAELVNSIEEYDEIIANFKAIENQIKEFKNKYSYDIIGSGDFDFSKIF